MDSAHDNGRFCGVHIPLGTLPKVAAVVFVGDSYTMCHVVQILCSYIMYMNLYSAAYSILYRTLLLTVLQSNQRERELCLYFFVTRI